MEIITIYDYLILPLYIILCSIIAVRASRRYNGTELKKFFLIAFFLRVFGGVSYSLLIYYYYGTGDMLSYYRGGEIIGDMIKQDITHINYMFLNGEELFKIAEQAGYMEPPTSMGNDANAFVMKVSSVISFFAFGKFLILSLLFSIMSFIGMWKIFTFLNEVSGGKHSKILGWVILYTPSIWFFGCGIQKEPICMLGIGLSVYYFYKSIVLKKYNIAQMIMMVAMMFVLLTVKDYIAIMLLASLFVVMMYMLIARTKHVILKGAIIFVLFLSVIIAFTFIDAASIIQQGIEVSVYQIQSSKKVYEIINEYDESSKSGFTISDIEPTFTSLFTHSLDAISNCLFRPFPWESKKIIIFFASIEAFLTLLATLYVLIRSRVIGFFASIFSSPMLLFCFTTTILFALLIGFTTFNFGTIVRYKIVALPFYFYFLVMVNEKYKPHPEATKISTEPIVV